MMKRKYYKNSFIECFAAKCGTGSSKLLVASVLAAFLISASYVLLAYATMGTLGGVYFTGNTTLNFTRTNFSVNWSGVTNAGGYYIYVNSGTGFGTNFSNTSATGYAVTGASNGQNYTFNIQAFNASNTSDLSANTTSSWMFVDTATPITALVNPSNGTVVSNKQTLNLNISVNDVGSGVAQCVANIGGNANVTVSASSPQNGWCNLTGISLANLALGVAPINIWVNDSVGNVLYNNSYAVTIGGPVNFGVTQWNTSNNAPSLNLSAKGIFFYDGNNVSAIVNFTTVGSDSAIYPYDNLTVTANGTSIGASPGVAATPLGGGLYRINALVNYSNLSASGISLTGSNVFYGAGMGLAVWNGTQPQPVQFANPQQASVSPIVLVNMSTIPSCPPDPTQVPPMIFWNGSMRNTTGCLASTVSPCNLATGPVYQNANGTVFLCGPVFNPATTTNFSAIAQSGNFSAVPLVLDVLGKAMINFSANPVDMSSQQKAGAIMQFAMKNLMAQGQFGINESEWNGQAGKPNLSVSATLTLYNVSGLFGNSNYYSINYGSFNGMNAPAATSLCPPGRCSGITYSNGNLTFTVSSFSSYIIGGANYSLNFANVSGPISQ
ncbi:Uncharacterised protein [uncultured archaeon]|nr:Uncharacterised protein [uncultured archaeon]